jgi:hypothetical protein
MAAQEGGGGGGAEERDHIKCGEKLEPPSEKLEAPIILASSAASLA